MASSLIDWGIVARQRVYIAMTLMSLILLGACGSSERDADIFGSPSGPSASAESPKADGTEQTLAEGVVELPLDAYQLSDKTKSMLLAAQQHLISRCMKAQGFDYSPVKDSDPPPRRIGVSDEEYGLSEFADAERFGYLGEDLNAKISGLTDGGSIRDELSPAYLKALTGNADPVMADGQPGGCVGQAAQRLNGGDDPAAGVLDVVAQIGLDAAARTRSDPDVLDGFKAWSQCMSAAGYSFNKPSEPARAVPQVVIDINDLEAIPEPSDTEVAMALADQNCKRQVGLFDIWVSTESRYQREGIDRNAAALSELKAAQERRAALAREVLEER